MKNRLNPFTNTKTQFILVCLLPLHFFSFVWTAWMALNPQNDNQLNPFPLQHLWQNCAACPRWWTPTPPALGAGSQPATATPPPSRWFGTRTQRRPVPSGSHLPGECRGNHVRFQWQRLRLDVSRGSGRHAGMCAEENCPKGGTKAGGGLLAALLAADLGQLAGVLSPKSFKGSERSDFKREPCKVCPLDGWYAHVSDNTKHKNTFELCHRTLGTVYRFRTDSPQMTHLWSNAICKLATMRVPKPLPANLMSFEWEDTRATRTRIYILYSYRSVGLLSLVSFILETCTAKKKKPPTKTPLTHSLKRGNHRTFPQPQRTNKNCSLHLRESISKWYFKRLTPTKRTGWRKK